MKKIFTLFLILSSFNLFAQTFTWTEQNSGTEDHLNDVFFVDNQTGWAVGGNGVILATTDGGQTWDAQTVGTTDGFRTVFFLDADTGWVASFNLQSTLFKTTDGGTTWTDITPESILGSIEDIAFANAMDGWMVADSIYKTTDGGITWLSQSITDQVSQTSYRALVVPTDSTAYVGGRSKRTSPSNAYADVFSTALSPTSSVDFMSGVGSMKTTDLGIRSIAYATSNIIFAGGTAGAIYKMEFEGQNNFGPWDLNLDLNPAEGSQFILSISFPTATDGMFLTEKGGALVYHTADTGNTWNMTPDTIAGLSPNALYAAGANDAWVVGSSGAIYMGKRITTSISNQDLSLATRVYPNPTTGLVTISIDSKSMALVDYGLWDLSGRKIKQGERTADGPNSTFTINVSDVKDGVYLLKVNTENETNTFRLLKK